MRPHYCLGSGTRPDLRVSVNVDAVKSPSPCDDTPEPGSSHFSSEAVLQKEARQSALQFGCFKALAELQFGCFKALAERQFGCFKALAERQFGCFKALVEPQFGCFKALVELQFGCFKALAELQFGCFKALAERAVCTQQQ